jgi:DNA-binding transcriptional ArsR family regulator
MIRDQQGELLPDEFIELVARRFTALAEPMRIRLLDALHVGEGASVSELAAALGATHANVSKHLNVLHSERIVGRRKEGAKFVYSIADETVLEICELVCGGVRKRLQELGRLVDASPGT